MYFYEFFKEIDKDVVNFVYLNNVKRVIRYLEIYFLIGRKLIEFLDKVRRKGSEKYNLLLLCFIMEREVLW